MAYVISRFFEFSPTPKKKRETRGSKTTKKNLEYWHSVCSTANPLSKLKENKKSAMVESTLIYRYDGMFAIFQLSLYYAWYGVLTNW